MKTKKQGDTRGRSEVLLLIGSEENLLRKATILPSQGSVRQEAKENKNSA